MDKISFECLGDVKFQGFFMQWRCKSLCPSSQVKSNSNVLTSHVIVAFSRWELGDNVVLLQYKQSSSWDLHYSVYSMCADRYLYIHLYIKSFIQWRQSETALIHDSSERPTTGPYELNHLCFKVALRVTAVLIFMHVFDSLYYIACFITFVCPLTEDTLSNW